MKLPKIQKVFLYGGFWFVSSVVPNYAVHVSNGMHYLRLAESYNEKSRVSRESKILMKHQENCFKELTNPWILIPGSFLWRWVERPNLRFPPEEKKNKKPFIVSV